MSLATSLLLAVVVVVSILGTGCAVAYAISRGRLVGGELLAYGIAAGVAVQALIGLATICVPGYYHSTALILLAVCNLAAWIYWWRNSVIQTLGRQGRWQPVLSLAGWLGLTVTCIIISFLPVRLPDPLPDPMYVLKADRLHVRVQALTGGLPADNYVPFAVGEFFLRDIQFSQERPLLPGQEISNRPVLMALAVLPYRAVLDPPPKYVGRLPRFNYVGTSWPDAGVLGEDRYFRQFLTVAIVLNATFIVAACLLMLEVGLSRRYVVAGLILLVCSPYFLNQTIFTWPKTLAAFYGILAAHATIYAKRWKVGGVLSAFGYLAHPYALVLAAGIGLCALVGGGKIPLTRRLQSATAFGLSFVILVLPWLIWSRFYLGIPSDLVQQNLGTGASLLDMVWVRISNTYTTLAPGYLSMFPFDPERFVQGSLVSLTGSVGIFFFIQGYAGCASYFNRMRDLILFAIVIPGAMLIGIFGIPTVPAMHGFQAISPLVLLVGLKWMQDSSFGRWLIPLVALQVVLNAMMLYVRGSTLGM